VRELALAALQTTFDLAQRVGPAELAEQHRHHLAPAREALGRVLRAGVPDQTLELSSGKQLQQLAEHAA
jgi:hypothetical protein